MDIPISRRRLLEISGVLGASSGLYWFAYGMDWGNTPSDPLNSTTNVSTPERVDQQLEQLEITNIPPLDDPISKIPAQADLISYIDLSAVLGDDLLRRTLNSFISQYRPSSRTVADLATLEAVPVQGTQVRDAIGYLKTDEPIKGGLIINSTWPTDSIILDQVPDGLDRTADNYQQTRLVGYRVTNSTALAEEIENDDISQWLNNTDPSIRNTGSETTGAGTEASESPISRLWVAEIDDGVYTIGNRYGVEEILDVHTNSADNAGSRFRNFGSEERFFEISASLSDLQSSDWVSDDQNPISQLRGLNIVNTRLTRNQHSIRLDAMAITSSEGTAQRYSTAINEIVRESEIDTNNWDIQQEEATLSIEITVEDDLLETELDQQTRFSYARNPPNINWHVSTTDQIVSITHGGGGKALVQNLWVIGYGFGSNQSADHTSPGVWQGDASGSHEGHDAIVKGDSVTISVRDTYEISILYRGPGTSTAVLKTVRSDSAPSYEQDSSN